MKDAKNKAIASAFEREINKQEKSMLAGRKKRIKAGGFKNERDYFTNVNPLTGSRGTHKDMRTGKHVPNNN